MLLFIFGTRPEAIKLAPVIHECQRQGVPYSVCVTAQHRQLLDPFTHFFKIQVDYDLDIMQPNQDLYQITSRALDGLSDVMTTVKPDCVVVQGDTTTALAGAMSGFYQRVPVAHVEAGLRTHDPHDPYPEEMNRKLIDHLASNLFAPTETNKQNLLEEGLQESLIEVTGNTIVDSLKLITTTQEFSDSQLPIELDNSEEFILLTVHRRENWGERLRAICDAVEEIVSQRSKLRIAIPVHLNPNVQKLVNERLGSLERVELLPPLGYVQFLKAMQRADLILSDSGGVQEEAPSFQKHVLVMRERTERPEGIAAGIAELVGADATRICESVLKYLDSNTERPKPFPPNPYGDGFAAERIVNSFEDLL